jgi:hypothetical protein
LEGNEIKITLVLSDTEYREETIEEATEFFNKPEFVHFIGLYHPSRKNLEACNEELEYTHFPPKTDINKDFNMRILEWQGLVWTIVSIPRTKIELMAKIADKNGLTLVNGTPRVFTAEGVKPFPIKDTDNTFVLEEKNCSIIVIGKKEIKKNNPR